MKRRTESYSLNKRHTTIVVVDEEEITFLIDCKVLQMMLDEIRLLKMNYFSYDIILDYAVRHEYGFVEGLPYDSFYFNLEFNPNESTLTVDIVLSNLCETNDMICKVILMTLEDD